MGAIEKLTEQIIQHSDENEALAALELLKAENPHKDDLICIMEYCPSEGIKNAAWELLKSKKLDNYDLSHIMIYCSSEGLKNAAWELLKTKNPSKHHLLEIVFWCPSDDLKNAAGELLIAQNPNDLNLTCIMRYCPSEDLKNAAWELLKEAVGVSDVNLPDQDELIKQIADKVLEKPAEFQMKPGDCGIASYLCVLNPLAKELEEKHGKATAAYVLLPKYVDQFYTDNETALNFLKSKI